MSVANGSDDIGRSGDGRSGDYGRSGESTSRSLLAEARLSDPAAWERMVRLYAPLVASWCRKWGLAEQDIGDVLQEVFSAVSVHLERFRKDRPGDTFRGWLSTITRNKVRDHYRRSAAEPTAAGGTEAGHKLQAIPDASGLAEVPCEMPGDSDDLLLDDLLRSALEAIRSEFHERTWRAFWGVVVEGRNAADVGADLQMSQGAVRVAKSRVLLRLRRELGDAPNERPLQARD